MATSCEQGYESSKFLKIVIFSLIEHKLSSQEEIALGVSWFIFCRIFTRNLYFTYVIIKIMLHTVNG